MKDWYLTREESHVIHRGKKVTPNSLIRLTPAQATAHKDAVVACDAPQTILDCAFPFEFEEWRQKQPGKPAPTDTVDE